MAKGTMAPPTVKKTDNHRSELVRLINKLAQRHSLWQVFEDFLALSALSISNSVDLARYDEREEQYLSIVGKYDKAEVDLFPEMFAQLVLELERHAEKPHDILGEIFHELNLHNERKGQFFTPQCICDFMGHITFGDHKVAIEDKGYISVCEPCCGAGAMILGFAGALIDGGYSSCRNMLVTAIDIDFTCVCMCYIQLSLYGIPATVVHGNSIMEQEWSRWYTPLYFLGGWVWRQAEQYSTGVPEVNATGETGQMPAPATVTAEFDVTLRENDDGQFAFNLFGGI
jgi:hypothetical protein